MLLCKTSGTIADKDIRRYTPQSERDVAPVVDESGERNGILDHWAVHDTLEISKTELIVHGEVENTYLVPRRKRHCGRDDPQ